ncbi:MAG: SDR family oxidoreductase [Thermodesulfobacteriota bacterium]
MSPKDPLWLVTGVAGFIGSSILETLLKQKQRVVGLDNFSTGRRRNLDEVRELVGPENWTRFTFVEGDIRDLNTCRMVCQGVDAVLHQAAIGSVPHSIEDPLFVHDNNLTGYLNMLVAARDAKVRRFVYAASSSTYGESPEMPKVEDVIGRPLSPYAVTKYADELYAEVFSSAYGFKSIGLRYFNIFGPRQDPEGGYAAVIPKWFASLVKGETVFINGDGETSRDFCYVDNCVQANLLAASTSNPDALGQIFNVALGKRTTLNQLFLYIRDRVAAFNPGARSIIPEYRDFRPGDVLHSLADISKAKRLLGFHPKYSVMSGLDKAAEWYIKNL